MLAGDVGVWLLGSSIRGTTRLESRQDLPSPTLTVGKPFQSPRPATFPRSTVTDALGSVNVLCELAGIVVAAGGLSGSG